MKKFKKVSLFSVLFVLFSLSIVFACYTIDHKYEGGLNNDVVVIDGHCTDGTTFSGALKRDGQWYVAGANGKANNSSDLNYVLKYICGCN